MVIYLRMYMCYLLAPRLKLISPPFWLKSFNLATMRSFTCAATLQHNPNKLLFVVMETQI